MTSTSHPHPFTTTSSRCKQQLVHACIPYQNKQEKGSDGGHVLRLQRADEETSRGSDGHPTLGRPGARHSYGSVTHAAPGANMHKGLGQDAYHHLTFPRVCVRTTKQAMRHREQ